MSEAMEALANASIEQIEAMGETGELPVAAVGDGEGAAVDEQGVAEASPGQDDEQDKGSKGSDKELNFAKLRTKAESMEREVQRLAEENKRLVERQYVAELPADHAQKVLEVDAQLAELGGKFQNGEIQWEEYQSQLREASQLREGLVATSLKADISREMREQAAKEQEAVMSKSWEETVANFIAAKPDSLDYAADEAKSRSLNTYVKALGADPDNNGQPMDWFLQEAHALVKAKHGLANSQATTSAVSKPSEVKQSVPFHTLSDVPGGMLPAKNEIEAMQQLSGAALVNRFMNDPSKIDDYLASLG